MVSESLVVEIYSFISLAILLIFSALWTGFARRKTSFSAAPEDAKLGAGADGSSIANSGAEPGPVARAHRIHQNHIENILLFWISYAALTYSGANVWGSLTLLIIFVVSRYLYTLVYILGLQPWRTICYMVGLLDIIVTLAYAGIQVWFIKTV